MLVACALPPTGNGVCPPAVRTALRWGGPSGSGGPGLPGGCPAPLVLSHPPVPAAWGPGLGLLVVGPSLLGVAVTCAAACFGAGAAVAAGSLGGSAPG